MTFPVIKELSFCIERGEFMKCVLLTMSNCQKNKGNSGQHKNIINNFFNEIHIGIFIFIKKVLNPIPTAFRERMMKEKIIDSFPIILIGICLFVCL